MEFYSGGIARVDPTHPLVRGLQAFAVGPHLVWGGNARVTGTAAPVVGRYGRAVVGDNLGISMGAFPAQTDSTSFTLMLVAATTTAEGGIGYRNGGGPGTSFCKLTPGNASNATPKINYMVNGASRSADATALGAQPGQHVVIAVKNGLTLDLWVDGRLGASNTWTTGQLTKNAATCYYGPDETVGANVELLCGGFWPNIGLRRADIAALSRNPLQFVE